MNYREFAERAGIYPLRLHILRSFHQVFLSCKTECGHGVNCFFFCKQTWNGERLSRDATNWFAVRFLDIFEYMFDMFTGLLVAFEVYMVSLY